MKKWFATLPENTWPIAVTAVVIYVAIILFTRLAGKRSLSKMSSFDFAGTVAVGSVFASTILLKNVSLLQGLIGLTSLYVLQMLVAVARKFRVIQRLVDNRPCVLMDGEEVKYDNLKRCNLSLTDLRGKLREANVTQRRQVEKVIFETTGDISVLHHPVENRGVDPWIMEDVDA